MIASEDKLQARVVLGVSLAMAGIFIYAAIDKIRDPLQFADSVAAFGILPAVFVSLLALALPPFEIACGLLMLAPRTRRIGALAITLLSAIFFTALASALLRGLTLDCGCFGAGAPSRPRMWLELVLDMVLFASALWVYLRSITQPSLE
ncbi:MauE/DoxX family redox-associated membrane protein [Candidatus Binatus sp.]